MEKDRVKIGKPMPKFSDPTIKLTTAAILREEMLLRKKKEEEEKHLAEVEIGLRDAREFEQWQEEAKMKEREDIQLHQERKRLEIQLLHEEAYLAKMEKVKENKVKAAEIHALKEEQQQITLLVKEQIQQENKKKVEFVHDIKEGAIKAKQKLNQEKAKRAAELAQESQKILLEAQKRAEEEILKKQELIKQIRSIEKNVPQPKQIDPNETSGMGLLGEMSIAEVFLLI